MLKTCTLDGLHIGRHISSIRAVSIRSIGGNKKIFQRQKALITGELKSKVDRIWDTMWSGGISNPLSVIEQLTYLLFIKRLDEIQTLKESKAARTGKAIEDPIFNKKQDSLRWSRFKESAPK